MAEYVVHRLEAVEVGGEHGKALPRGRRDIERGGHAFIEGRPVRQIGERVVMRHMLDARLVTFAVGQIVNDADEILHVAICALHRQPHRGDDAGAVSGRDDDVFLGLNGLTGLDQLLIVLADGLDRAFRHDLFRGLAEYRAALETEILLGGAVDQHVTQLRILHDDRRRHILDDLIEKRAGTLQAAFGSFLLCDVFVGRCPAAAFYRLVDDGDDTAVGQFDVECEGFALLERRP